jgi:hypothetical protein
MVSREDEFELISNADVFAAIRYLDTDAPCSRDQDAGVVVVIGLSAACIFIGIMMLVWLYLRL